MCEAARHKGRSPSKATLLFFLSESGVNRSLFGPTKSVAWLGGDAQAWTSNNARFRLSSVRDRTAWLLRCVAFGDQVDRRLQDQFLQAQVSAS